MKDDTISRQAALDALGERPVVWSDNDDYTLGERNQYDMDRLAIETVPSAQPERKKGKWIERNPRNSPDCRLIECSECGNAYIVGYNINYDDWIDGRNFCMKCGADLRGGSNVKNT